jgi:DnaJ-class molecular chaperone
VVSDWEILGLKPTTDMQSIVVAKRRAIMQAHPDRPGGSKESTDAILKAYARLKATVETPIKCGKCSGKGVTQYGGLSKACKECNRTGLVSWKP